MGVLHISPFLRKGNLLVTTVECWDYRCVLPCAAFHGFGDLNSGPHTCVTNIDPLSHLPAEKFLLLTLHRHKFLEIPKSKFPYM